MSNLSPGDLVETVEVPGAAWLNGGRPGLIGVVLSAARYIPGYLGKLQEVRVAPGSMWFWVQTLRKIQGPPPDDELIFEGSKPWSDLNRHALKELVDSVADMQRRGVRVFK